MGRYASSMLNTGRALEGTSIQLSYAQTTQYQEVMNLVLQTWISFKTCIDRKFTCCSALITMQYFRLAFSAHEDFKCQTHFLCTDSWLICTPLLEWSSQIVTLLFSGMHSLEHECHNFWSQRVTLNENMHVEVCRALPHHSQRIQSSI